MFLAVNHLFTSSLGTRVLTLMCLMGHNISMSFDIFRHFEVLEGGYSLDVKNTQTFSLSGSMP